MEMKGHWKTYLFWIALAEGVGALAGWLTREGTAYYKEFVEKPALAPPAILFPIVWGILYALMGIGAARVSLTPTSKERSVGLNLFVAQLVVNFFWSLIFFNLRTYGLALLWLGLLWVLILWMSFAFRRSDRWAAWLQIPGTISTHPGSASPTAPPRPPTGRSKRDMFSNCVSFHHPLVVYAKAARKFPMTS